VYPARPPKERRFRHSFREYRGAREDVEGQNPAEPGTNGNVTSGEGQPAIVVPPPVYSQEIYSPPPAYAPPAQVPPAYYAPYQAAPPAKQSHMGRTLFIIGLILVLLVAAGGAGAVLANASLASTYSAERTVTDYFAAQKSGNTAYMLANANYLRGDGSYSEYFDAGGLAAMLAIPQNTDIKDVNVASTTIVDTNTSTVNVTMTWGGHHVVQALTVHRDLTRVHYNLYNSWRIDIPFASINVTLPNQPGSIAVDGLTLPQGALKDIQVIEGYHKVTMDATDIYTKASADADAISSGATVTFPSTISATALASARNVIKKAFNVCDKATNARQDCLGHTYYAPNAANTIYYFTDLPGYGQVQYSRYVLALTSDPTKTMKLVVSADAGKMSAGGACGFTLTVDGSRKYNFKGSWTATITVSAGKFDYSTITGDCLKSKA
jgi:archaellum component FlaF (FlaF/FlaG flagellin family)